MGLQRFGVPHFQPRCHITNKRTSINSPALQHHLASTFHHKRTTTVVGMEAQMRVGTRRMSFLTYSKYKRRVGSWTRTSQISWWEIGLLEAQQMPAMGLGVKPMKTAAAGMEM